MKQVFLSITVLLSIFFLSCKTNHLSGLYVCDQENLQPDTTIQHGAHHEGTLNLTCVVTDLEFKGSSTVSIHMKAGQIFSNYTIDDDYVRIRGDKSDIVLKIKDENTLVGEGFTQGIYHKK